MVSFAVVMDKPFLKVIIRITVINMDLCKTIDHIMLVEKTQLSW